MNNKLFLATTALALLLLSGCGQSTPDLPASSNNISDASALTGDTVSINETNYDSEKSNSSSDGFQSVYFDFGDYSISAAMGNSIAKNISVGLKSTGKIKIEGNCDEFGTDEYNYALGLKRAKAVKDAMTAGGMSSSRVVIVSYGESNPVCTSPTDSCYGKNRRVDLRLIK